MSALPPRRRLNTVREVCQDYLTRDVTIQSGTRNTKDRRRLIDLFVALHGDATIDDLIPDDLEKWIEGQPRLRSNWTRTRVARVIQRPFSWALNKGLIDRHPFKGVSYPAGERFQAMSEEDFRTVLRNTDAAFRRVLLFLWWTGCRPNELCDLQWEFIDVEKGVATLHKHKTAKSRKDRAARTICLPEKALRLLTWLLDDQRRETTHVFLNRARRPWNRNAMALRFYRLRKWCKLPLTVKLYGCRHSFGTRMAMAGVDLKTLSLLMGHTTTRMSEHYIHMAGETEHLHKALEKGLAHNVNKNKKDTP